MEAEGREWERVDVRVEPDGPPGGDFSCVGSRRDGCGGDRNGAEGRGGEVRARI